MNTMLRRFRCVVAVVCCLGVLSCVQETVDGPGTGSETTNGFTATIRYQDGTPVANASVKLRPSDYLKDLRDGISKRSLFVQVDTQTDSAGRFSLLGLDMIQYFIEVLDPQKVEGVLINCRPQRDTILDYGIVYLDPVGAITGTVDTSGLPSNTALYVQIEGLDRAGRIDAASGDFRIDGVAAGIYTVRLHTGEAAYLPEIISNVAVEPSVITMLDTITLTPLRSWCCRSDIYLNTTKNGADVTATITRFPVLVRLNSSNFDFAAARPDGGDLRFVKADDTPLPYQIERWEPENRRAEVWVKVDTIFGNSDAHYFSMLWGNPGASGEANGGAVFDTSMGFEGVWHMDETDSSAISDATANGFDGRKYSMGAAPAVEGICGRAQRFDGASGYIVLSNTASGKLDFPEDGVYSVSAWVNAQEINSEYHSIISKGNQHYGLQLTRDYKWQFFEFQNRAGWDGTEAEAFSQRWVYLVGIRSGARQYLYVDGVLADSTITNVAGETNRITSDNVFIGRRTLDTTRYWNGSIDEVRLCRWAHSHNWIRLCYMNQKAADQLTEFRKPDTIGTH